MQQRPAPGERLPIALSDLPRGLRRGAVRRRGAVPVSLRAFAERPDSRKHCSRISRRSASPDPAPEIADEVPWSDNVTECDDRHEASYLRLLDADAEGAGKEDGEGYPPHRPCRRAGTRSQGLGQPPCPRPLDDRGRLPQAGRTRSARPTRPAHGDPCPGHHARRHAGEPTSWPRPWLAGIRWTDARTMFRGRVSSPPGETPASVEVVPHASGPSGRHPFVIPRACPRWWLRPGLLRRRRLLVRSSHGRS